MTTATKEKQTLLGEFGIKLDAISRLADTIELHHERAYTGAALEFLKDKEGLLDYKLLKDSKIRDSMADHMADFYISKAKEYFKIDEKASKLSDIQKEMLMNAYAGITRGQLKSEIHKAEDKFTLQHFHGRVADIKKRVYGTLLPSAYAHISNKPEHKNEILKEMENGLEKKIDAELISLEDLFPIMMQHHEEGAVSPRLYEKHPAYIAMQGKQKAAAHK